MRGEHDLSGSISARRGYPVADDKKAPQALGSDARAGGAVGLTGYDALGRPAGQIGGPLQPGGELQQRLAELLGPLDRNEVPRITEHHLAPGRQARAKFGDVFLDAEHAVV